MAEIKSGNWSFKDPEVTDDRTGAHVSDGDTILGGNFSQHTPGTEIMKGYKTLTVRGGNFVNVTPQPGWKIEGGNWHQVSRCSHTHPEWVAKGLPECPADCQHRSTEMEWIEIPVEEFREAKKALAAKDILIAEAVDLDGVKTQKFKKRVFTYKDGGA